MSDLEQAVIKAARELHRRWSERTTGIFSPEATALMDAIDALDESLVPDPWQILQDLYSEFGFSISIDHSTPTGPELLDRVMGALEWRRTHES